MDMIKIGDELITLLSLYGLRLIAAIAILLVGSWIARALSRAIDRGLGRRHIDSTIRQFVSRLIYALILLFAIVAALSNIGVQTASIVAALGAAGLAIGLALQGSLSNFAAGVLMVLFRPCRVGDYIEAAGCAGTVTQISLFSTTLVTSDNKQIVIPNGSVMSGPITNFSALSERRLDIRVRIGYDADIRHAKRELAALVAADSRILQTPAPTIAVLELADTSVNLIVRPWVKAADYWKVHFDLTEAIKLRFDEVGIVIPVQQGNARPRDPITR